MAIDQKRDWKTEDAPIEIPNLHITHRNRIIQIQLAGPVA
jgi:hypothetical protein